MKMRKKTFALLLFSVAFMCSVGVSAFVLWQTDALDLQKTNQPVMSDDVQTRVLYPAVDAAGLWGYIDEQGTWQVPAKFEQAMPFEGKAAWIKQYGLWGAIDTAGEFIVQPEYADIEMFADGANRFVAAFNSVVSSQLVNSSLYDINGQKLFGLSGRLRAPSSGLMAFSRIKGGVTTWGFINPHGEIIIEPIYTEVGQAAGNFAVVKDDAGQTMLLNIYAKTAVPFAAAQDMNAVGSRLVLVQDDTTGLYGYMDVDGNLQINYAFSRAEAFRGGAALAAGAPQGAAGDAAGLYGLLTPEGVWALEPAYSGGKYLDNGVYALKLADEPGYHIVNALGEMIVDGTVWRYDEWRNGYMACYTAGSTQFVDTNAELKAGLTLDLLPGAYWQGRLYAVQDVNGISWFAKDGTTVYTQGRDLELTDGMRLVTELEKTSPAYVTYYPQVTCDGNMPTQWRRLNTALKAVAVDDYFDEFMDGEEINFTVWGGFKLQPQGNVITVCQQLQLDDSWQAGGSDVENIVHTVCFDQNTGRQYRLGDLFADSVNWRTELLQPLKISYELQCARSGGTAEGEAVQVEVLELLSKRLARNVDFACGADGVTLYFALSDGSTVAIKLLYADVDEWLDKDGAMWQSLGAAAAE